ncbi:MAG: tripartite tricarboxylate transporter substrate-binding protein, partial [Bacillota bacterium]
TAIAAAAGGIDAQLVAASSGEVAQYLEAGSLVALANMATEASGSIPSICDYLPELEEYLPIQQWLGFMVPADTDAAVLAELEEAFLATVASDSFAEFAEAQAADIFALTGDEAKAFAETSESKLCWLLYDLGAATYSPADSGIERS